MNFFQFFVKFFQKKNPKSVQIIEDSSKCAHLRIVWGIPRENIEDLWQISLIHHPGHMRPNCSKSRLKLATFIAKIIGFINKIKLKKGFRWPAKPILVKNHVYRSYTRRLKWISYDSMSFIKISHIDYIYLKNFLTIPLKSVVHCFVNVVS